MMSFTVPPCQGTPISIRNFIRKQGISLTQWRRIKRTGSILINGSQAAPDTPLFAGDLLVLVDFADSSIIPTDIPLSVIYEDDNILITDKPPGMLVHPAREDQTHSLANAVMHYYQKKGWNFTFHPVLRLDRNTSGLVLIAKQPYVQHMLSNSPQTISKRYYAIVSGCPEPKKGMIDAPIARHPNSIIERIVCNSGQKAITRYETIRNYRRASLMEVELLTGRTHQIRVHFSYLGHPLLGDELYGGPVDVINRQALHAAHLSFRNPISGHAIQAHSQLPADLLHVIKVIAAEN